jgi:hypothetical protein
MTITPKNGRQIASAGTAGSAEPGRAVSLSSSCPQARGASRRLFSRLFRDRVAARSDFQRGLLAFDVALGLSLVVTDWTSFPSD